METNNSDQSSDEPISKRPKIEMKSSTSSKPESKDPFLSLPSDIHAKIIAHLPIAQWPTMELVSKNFLSVTWIAWRQLRYIDVERELSKSIITTNNANAASSPIINKVARIESILQKLVERSPFLSRIDIILDDAELNTDAITLLAKFEHLQSISMGDAKWISGGRGGIQLENVITFLESTRSRTSLKELHLLRVEGWSSDLDRFATTFANGREIQSPLKLEKFTFMSSYRWLNIRLDTMDTTRLTDVRFGRAAIEPEQLTNLIERASNLRGIEFSFFGCSGDRNCPRLPANKKLLVALASHENLTSIRFAHYMFRGDAECTSFRPEFLEMLKTIGRRGKLRKLGMEPRFIPQCLDMDEISTAIHDYLPYLQSIKLHNGIGGHLTEDNVCNIVSLTGLEEIDFVTWDDPLTANAIKIIAQLPHLKRLAFSNKWNGADANSLASLANATSLIDLRIGDARHINAETLEKWSNGFASNLQILMVREIDEKDEHTETGLVQLLEKAVRLRILVLHGHITDRSLMAISKSCPDLEILEILELEPRQSGITIQRLQEVVDRCPKLKRLGGIGDEIRMQLKLSKNRKIIDVDTNFWSYWRYNYDNRDYDI